MTYKWYSPRGNMVKLTKYMIKRSRNSNAIVFVLGCLLYAIFDIYGVMRAPALASWIINDLKQQGRKVKQWQRKKAR